MADRSLVTIFTDIDKCTDSSFSGYCQTANRQHLQNMEVDNISIVSNVHRQWNQNCVPGWIKLDKKGKAFFA